MAITFEQLQAKFPFERLDPKEWRRCANGGGWVHSSANIDPSVYIGPSAVVYGGTIWGGTIRGGTIRGGTIRGGTIRGGTIRGGTIEGGTIEGGTIWGGTIYGGTWRFAPLQIQGTRHFVNVSSPTTIAIGCSNYKISECTQESFAEVGKQNGYTPDQIAEYGMIITLCANWLKQKFPEENIYSVNRDAKGRFVKREMK